MAKKTAEKPQEKPDSGFFCYIGPNIKGLIQTGTVYRGTREDAHRLAGAAIEKQPLVKTLIVSGEALPEARIKVKTPGNVLYANYQRLVLVSPVSGGGSQDKSNLAGKERD